MTEEQLCEVRGGPDNEENKMMTNGPQTPEVDDAIDKQSCPAKSGMGLLVAKYGPQVMAKVLVKVNAHKAAAPPELKQNDDADTSKVLQTSKCTNKRLQCADLHCCAKIK